MSKKEAPQYIIIIRRGDGIYSARWACGSEDGKDITKYHRKDGTIDEIAEIIKLLAKRP